MLKQEACNFNAEADYDNASCLYPELYCDGTCLSDVDGDGICVLKFLGALSPKRRTTKTKPQTTTVRVWFLDAPRIGHELLSHGQCR